MLPEYDIVVVGAGPAGSIAAKYAAEKGVSVLVLEKDREVGIPVRCGEAVRRTSFIQFVEPDEKWIASEIKKFAFVAPNNGKVVLDYPETGYVLNRKIFDVELARQASATGALFVTRAYVNGLILENGKVCGVKFEYNGEQKTIKSKIVIAADGVESRVGRWAGLQTNIDFRDMECCYQVTAANINVDENTCCFYFGKDVAPEGYLWIFPKGNGVANVGIGVSGKIGKRKSASSYLNDFLNKNFPDASVLTSVAGGVPCTTVLKKISSYGIMIAGDAARQVNPLSGGGIVSGMVGGSIAGRIAADSIINNNPELVFTYESEWENRLGKKHRIYNRIKEGIYNFSDEKFNSLITSFDKIPQQKRTLGSLFRTALFNQPSLLLDVAKVFID